MSYVDDDVVFGYDDLPEEDEEDWEDEYDWVEPADLEMGYDPYLGCYTDDV